MYSCLQQIKSRVKQVAAYENCRCCSRKAEYRVEHNPHNQISLKLVSTQTSAEGDGEAPREKTEKCQSQPTDFPLTFSSCSSVAAVHGDRYFVILHFYTFNMGLSLFACHQAQLIDWQITLYKTDEATKRLTRRLLRTFEQKHLLSKTKVR